MCVFAENVFIFFREEKSQTRERSQGIFLIISPQTYVNHEYVILIWTGTRSDGGISVKNIVLIGILEYFADWEAAYVSSFLQAMGQDRFCVKTVSLKNGPVRSMGGFTVLPDCDVLSAPEDFAGLILIGGMSWRNEAARQIVPLVETAVRNKAVVGGICDASAFLGTLGVLNTVRHTSNDLQDLQKWAGDAYTGASLYLREPAVRDGMIVTANGTASLEFAREVLTALGVAPEEQILAWYNYHKFGCYAAPVPEM